MSPYGWEITHPSNRAHCGWHGIHSLPRCACAWFRVGLGLHKMKNPCKILSNIVFYIILYLLLFNPIESAKFYQVLVGLGELPGEIFVFPHLIAILPNGALFTPPARVLRARSPPKQPFGRVPVAQKIHPLTLAQRPPSRSVCRGAFCPSSVSRSVCSILNRLSSRETHCTRREFQFSQAAFADPPRSRPCRFDTRRHIHGTTVFCVILCVCVYVFLFARARSSRVCPFA